MNSSTSRLVVDSWLGSTHIHCQHNLYITISAQIGRAQVWITSLIALNPSKMASLSLEETLGELSLEEDLTTCTKDKSDWSSQAGNHFAHLKNIDQPTRQRSILKTGFTTEARQVSDLSTLSTHKEEPTTTPQEEEPIMKKRCSSVSFHEINLRYHDQTIPPIALDWHYEEAEPIRIDDYEEHRGSRRTLRQLMISNYTRKNWLM